jgi:hypothetical protein
VRHVDDLVLRGAWSKIIAGALPSHDGGARLSIELHIRQKNQRRK